MPHIDKQQAEQLQREFNAGGLVREGAIRATLILLAYIDERVDTCDPDTLEILQRIGASQE